MIPEIILILCYIESGMNNQAWNRPEDACGVLQIRKIMVDEVNRISGEERFTYADRWNALKAAQMCSTFLSYQKKRWQDKYFGAEPSPVQLACSWNTGNIMKPMPKHYKMKFEKYWAQRPKVGENAQ